METIAWTFSKDFGLSSDSSDLIIFGEQNDPFRMTLSDYVKDSTAASLDQFDRMAIWRRFGSRVLDFPYVQPALSTSHQPDHTLFLRAIVRISHENPSTEDELEGIDPVIVREHLTRFFAVSVLKGRPGFEADQTIQGQLKTLQALTQAGKIVQMLPMPSSEKLTEWKTLIKGFISDSNVTKDALIGDLLGFTSVSDAIKITDGKP
jgi:hypothetical protein